MFSANVEEEVNIVRATKFIVIDLPGQKDTALFVRMFRITCRPLLLRMFSSGQRAKRLKSTSAQIAALLPFIFTTAPNPKIAHFEHEPVDACRQNRRFAVTLSGNQPRCSPSNDVAG